MTAYENDRDVHRISQSEGEVLKIRLVHPGADSGYRSSVTAYFYGFDSGVSEHLANNEAILRPKTACHKIVAIYLRRDMKPWRSSFDAPQNVQEKFSSPHSITAVFVLTMVTGGAYKTGQKEMMRRVELHAVIARHSCPLSRRHKKLDYLSYIRRRQFVNIHVSLL